MKFLTLPIIIITLIIALQSCSNQGLSLDAAQQGAIVDSLVEVKSVALKDSINTACEKRMQTEVVAKADSILKAMQAE